MANDEVVRECILFFAAKKDKKKNIAKKKLGTELKTPSQPKENRQNPGALRGKIKIAKDFDQQSPQITQLFGLKKNK